MNMKRFGLPLLFATVGFFLGAGFVWGWHDDWSDSGKWENVHLDDDLIRFVPEKTSRGKRRNELSVPIHPALKLHLEALKKTAAEGQIHVCPALQGKSVSGRSGLSKAFIEDVMAKAGINNQANSSKVTGKGRAFSSLSFHSLRHSFNSELANKGVSQELRRHLTGHATDKMNDIYSHLDKKLLKTAVNKLPAKKSSEGK